MGKIIVLVQKLRILFTDNTAVQKLKIQAKQTIKDLNTVIKFQENLKECRIHHKTDFLLT
ncbi:Hypothetical protein MHC_06000 [Mycoplasma haemocanis str. Illinois]|uniref:Uncharacterized protein n=1 Tax=Mycoplasma haemocanis (strain Illinois) TaxID=1111676 RepID=I6QUL2_MYCHN|nr:Hypothetical protein MHC_06000 [Mycoplasma haemocanis str. Illinois]